MQPSLLQPFLLRFLNCFHDFLCRACGLLSSARSCTAEASVFSQFFLDSGRGDAPSQSYPGHRHVPDLPLGHQEEGQLLTNSFSVTFLPSMHIQSTDLARYESFQSDLGVRPHLTPYFSFPSLLFWAWWGLPEGFNQLRQERLHKKEVDCMVVYV